MFAGCLDLTLRFLGLQPVPRGCPSTDLSDFICEDLLPYQGWAANATLRDTIVRLLLTTHADAFQFYTLALEDTVEMKETARGVGVTATASASTARMKRETDLGVPAAKVKGNAAFVTSATLAKLTSYAGEEHRRRPLTAAAAIQLLDTGRVAWSSKAVEPAISGVSAEATPKAPSRPVAGPLAMLFRSSSAAATTATLSTPDTADKARQQTTSKEVLFFVPTLALREKAFGFSLQSERFESIARFLAENAVEGWDHIPYTAAFHARYKSHLLVSGLKILRRQHRVSIAHLFHETTNKIEVRLFPFFALPLTEREKAEAPEWMTEVGSSTAVPPSPSDDAPSSPASTPPDAAKEPFRMSVLQLRSSRCYHPIDHYFARKRRQDPSFPRGVFDLSLVKGLIAQSPERRLLLQDAAHVILHAHHLVSLRWEDFTRVEKVNLRRMMNSAGLRIVTVTLVLRGRPRSLQLVMPLEDLLQRQREAREPAQKAQPSPSTLEATADAVSRKRAREEGATEVESESAAKVKMAQEDEGGVRDQAEDDYDDERSALVWGDAVLRETVEGEDEGNDDNNTNEGSSASDSDEEDDDDEEEGTGQHARHTRTRLNSSAALPTGTVRQQQAEAQMVLLLDPSQPIEVQAAHEAERRRLAVTAVYPHFRLSTREKVYRRMLHQFFEDYAKQRHTVEVQHLLSASRSFMVVYSPRETPWWNPSTAAATGAVTPEAAADAERSCGGALIAPVARAVKEEPKEDEETTPVAPAVAAPTPLTTPDAADPAVLLSGPALLHFRENDPRLPKGTTAYSVNTVLDLLLHSPPFYAASLSRFNNVIDLRVLNRRVLPLLRELQLVYTTASARRGRTHIGMVVLRRSAVEPSTKESDHLDEDAKQAVLKAEATMDENQWSRNTGGHTRGTAAGADGEAYGAAALVRLDPTPVPTNGGAIASNLVLDAVPAMPDGAAHSSLAKSLLQGRTRATRSINRVMAVRNGYARNALQRVSRLHLELWAQSFLYPAETTSEEGVRVSDVYERMSLSTYCVVIGLPQGDLAGFMNPQEKGGDGSRGVFDWSTPLHALPPSLNAWCKLQGMHMLCMCFEELQERQLLRSRESFHDLLQRGTLEAVRYTLCPSGTLEGYTHHFVTSPLCAASSLYACLRYWRAEWNAVTVTSSGFAQALLATEPNPSPLQIIALSRVNRREEGAMAAQLYQNCGVPRRRRRGRRFGDLQRREGRRAGAEDDDGEGTATFTGDSGRAKAERLSFSRTAWQSTATHVPDAEAAVIERRDRRALAQLILPDPNHDDDGGAAEADLKMAPEAQSLDVHRRRAARARAELSGPAIAQALELAFHHFAPLRRVEEVVRVVLRLRAALLFSHPLFTVPTPYSPVLRRGAQLRPRSATDHWVSASGFLVSPTEFNTAHVDQGGSSYNRILRPTIAHLGILADALRSVRQGRITAADAATSPQLRQALAPPGSATETLRDEVESVFAPQAAVPETETETAGSAVLEEALFQGLAAQNRHRTNASRTGEATESHDHLEAHFEVATDILRMILFSDQVHYKASIARSLLAALSYAPLLVTRARAALQELPCFTSTSKSARRVPLLSLMRRSFVLHSNALRGAPRPCANLAVCHAWIQEVDSVGCTLSKGIERPSMRDAHLAFTSLLQASDDASVQGMSLPAPPLPVQLLHQPAMDLGSFNMAPNASMAAMKGLPLPRLQWPQEAVQCERLRRGCLDFSPDSMRGNAEWRAGGGETRGETELRRSRQRNRIEMLRRLRDPLRARGGLRKRLRDAAERDDDASDKEKEEDEEEMLSPAEAAALRELYPARTMQNGGDPSYLQDLPVDPPPTEREVHELEESRKALQDPTSTRWSTFENEGLADGTSPCGLCYPSIFHHVDGSFHAYMWQVTVHAVYRFLLRVPGIRHADLQARLMASGVLGQRSVQAVLRFLLAHRLVLETEEETSEDACVPAGGALGVPVRLPSPFRLFKRARAETAPEEAARESAWRTGCGGVHAMDRRCYVAVAPVEAVRLATSAASWC